MLQRPTLYVPCYYRYLTGKITPLTPSGFYSIYQAEHYLRRHAAMFQVKLEKMGMREDGSIYFLGSKSQVPLGKILVV